MPVFNVTSNPDKLNGTGGVDAFEGNKASDLQAADKISGGGGYDYMDFLLGGTVSDSQFSGVSNLEELDMGPGISSLTLEVGAKATAAGVVRVSAFDFNSNLVGGNLTVDASNYGKDFLTIDASGGQNTLTG